MVGEVGGGVVVVGEIGGGVVVVGEIGGGVVVVGEIGSWWWLEGLRKNEKMVVVGKISDGLGWWWFKVRGGDDC